MKGTHLLLIKFPDILRMNYNTLHPKSGIMKHKTSAREQLHSEHIKHVPPNESWINDK
jgi:hypothetical protein